jgi:hypothetical protein
VKDKAREPHSVDESTPLSCETRQHWQGAGQGEGACACGV